MNYTWALLFVNHENFMIKRKSKIDFTVQISFDYGVWFSLITTQGTQHVQEFHWRGMFTVVWFLVSKIFTSTHTHSVNIHTLHVPTHTVTHHTLHIPTHTFTHHTHPPLSKRFRNLTIYKTCRYDFGIMSLQHNSRYTPNLYHAVSHSNIGHVKNALSHSNTLTQSKP